MSCLLGSKVWSADRSWSSHVVRVAVLVADSDAHRPGGAGNDLRGGIDVVGVEVDHLGLRDGPDLVAGQPGNLGLVRLAAAFSTPAALRISRAAGGVLVTKVNERSS